MIGVNGCFIFSFSLRGKADIVSTNDLLSFTIIESCGSPILPYFELSFSLHKKEYLEYFNDKSIIDIQMGKSTNDLKDLELIVKKVMDGPAQADTSTVLIRGLANNMAYLANAHNDSTEATSKEVIGAIATKNGFKFSTNVDKSNDKMLWQQASESDFKFLHKVWLHNYINDNTLTLMSINIENEFRYRNIISDIAKSRIKYTYTTANPGDGEQQIHSDFKQDNNAILANNFGNYIKEYWVYNVSKRSYELIKAPENVPIISESNTTNTDESINKNHNFKYLTPSMHDNYYKAEIYNRTKMLAITASQIWVTIHEEYSNVHPLDLVMLLAKESNNQSCAQYSGLYIVTKVVRTIQDKRMITSALLSRESFNRQRVS